MSKPWDNEPTPTTKQAILDTHGHWTFELRDRMQNLERRLRHAERLLDKSWKTGEIDNIDELHKDVMRHLEAAQQEDRR